MALSQRQTSALTKCFVYLNLLTKVIIKAYKIHTTVLHVDLNCWLINIYFYLLYLGII